jgi:hypothetical protein
MRLADQKPRVFLATLATSVLAAPGLAFHACRSLCLTLDTDLREDERDGWSPLRGITWPCQALELN